MPDEYTSVLLGEQNVHVVLEVADHAFVLENGHIVCSGAAAELGADDERAFRFRLVHPPRSGTWTRCCRRSRIAA